MALTITATGTVENSDIQRLVITRSGGGDLSATVTFAVTVGGTQESRTASWTLTNPEKTAIGGLLPGAKAAIEAELGL